MKKTRKIINFRIALNGTDENPFHKWNLTQNPFPQLARAETDRHVLVIQSLGGDPIPNTDYIRKRLHGHASQELIDLCCQNFKKGEYVRFTIHWPEEE